MLTTTTKHSTHATPTWSELGMGHGAEESHKPHFSDADSSAAEVHYLNGHRSPRSKRILCPLHHMHTHVNGRRDTFLTFHSIKTKIVQSRCKKGGKRKRACLGRNWQLVGALFVRESVDAWSRLRCRQQARDTTTDHPGTERGVFRSALFNFKDVFLL